MHSSGPIGPRIASEGLRAADRGILHDLTCCGAGWICSQADRARRIHRGFIAANHADLSNRRGVRKRWTTSRSLLKTETLKGSSSDLLSRTRSLGGDSEE